LKKASFNSYFTLDTNAEFVYDHAIDIFEAGFTDDTDFDAERVFNCSASPDDFGTHSITISDYADDDQSLLSSNGTNINVWDNIKARGRTTWQQINAGKAFGRSNRLF